MSGFEIAGVVGLLASVKGAVETFNLLADVFASDTGLGRVALLYNLESIRFKLWCDNIKVDDQSACLLNKVPIEIQTCVANVIAEIVKTQNTINMHFSTKYRLPPLVNLPSNPTFDPKSPFIAQLRSQCSKIKLTHRWSWVTRQKQELEDLVKQIEKLNANLDRLVPQAECDETRLVKAVMTQFDERLSLASLFDPKGSEDSLLSLACQIKTIQEEDSGTMASVKHIENRDIEIFCDSEVMHGRYTGIYRATGGHEEKVIVEWKGITASTSEQRDIVARIHILSARLSTRNAEPFHRMPFVGILDDKDSERRSQGNRRIGLVYRVPKSIGSLESPPSLAQLIKLDTAAKTRPALGNRFELAYKLASAMSLFHATNWLHKSFRSDNILFGEDADVTKPYISGFGYSRPAAEDSIETRPVGDPMLDLYYHPDVMKGWTKIKDIYSLGMVLLEVAFWRSMFEQRFREMDLHQMSADIMASLDGKFGQDLVGMVGQVYVDVVRRCLTSSFGVQTGETCQEAERLSRAFSLLVIQPLASCKA